MPEAPQAPSDPLPALVGSAGTMRPAPRPVQPRVPENAGRLPRVAVVLAAGRSERLGKVTGGGSKALVRLGGLRLAERAVRNLLASGVERVLVVVGHDAGPVGAVVARLAPGRVRAIYADGWRDGNGASLAAVEAAVAEEVLFALLTADHVFSEGALDGLLRSGEPAALVDHCPEPDAGAERTRVRVQDGGTLAFGKHLDDPPIDCGAFLLPPEIFHYRRQAAAEGDHSLAGAVTRLAQVRPLRAVALGNGAWWQDIDTPQDLPVARGRLRRSLTRDADGPVSRLLNRPISTRLSMALSPLNLAPDLVSVLAFLTGLVAAGLLAAGQGVLGGVLTQLTSVLDGVDGEVARLQLRASPRGALLDGVLDRLGDAALIAGLGIWALHRSSLGPEAILVLVVAAAGGALLSMATKDGAAALGLRPAPERRIGWLLGGRDGRLLLIAVAAVASRPVAALLVVSVTSLLALLVRVAYLRRRA
jgi:CDP-L-myo-inositol myo-inositolphosphotransferase